MIELCPVLPSWDFQWRSTGGGPNLIFPPLNQQALLRFFQNSVHWQYWSTPLSSFVRNGIKQQPESCLERKENNKLRCYSENYLLMEHI